MAQFDPNRPPMSLEESEYLLRKADGQEHFWQNIGPDVYAVVIVLTTVAAVGMFFMGVSAVVGTTGAIVLGALYVLLRDRFKGS